MRTETIYIACSSDYELDSRLSAYFDHKSELAADNKRQLLQSLQQATDRSDIIFVVGGLSGDSIDCVPILADALGFEREQCPREKNQENGEQVFLIKGAVPLYAFSGTLAGVILASGGQMIVHLTEHPVRRMDGLLQVLDIVRAAAPDDLKQQENAAIQSEPLPQPDPPETPPPFTYTEFEVDVETMLEGAQPEPEPVVMDDPIEIETDGQGYHPIMEDEPPEEPGKPRRRALKVFLGTVAALTAAAVLFAGGVFVNRRFLSGMVADRVYDEARQLYGRTSAAELPENMLPAFGALYDRNPDIAGWIKIPETGIDYPVVQSDKTDYSAVLFNGQRNAYGTPYFQPEVFSDSEPRNLLVYGSAIDERLFGTLSEYGSLTFYKQVPVIDFSFAFSANRYKVFSMFEVAPDEAGTLIQDHFLNDNDFTEYLGLLKSKSLIHTTVEVDETDRLITLAAVKGKKKFVVAARRMRPEESEHVDVEDAVYEQDASIQAGNDDPAEAELVDNYDKDPLFPWQEESSQFTTISEVTASAAGSSKSGASKAGSSSKATSQKAGSSQAATSKAGAGTSGSGSSLAPSASSAGTSSAASSGTTGPGGTTAGGTLKIKNLSASGSPVVEGPAVDLIARNVHKEMSGSSTHVEALKAQTVAAYSYVRFHLANGSIPSLPLSDTGSVTQRIWDAVGAVIGQSMTVNGSIVQTTYFSISAGKTANAADVWGGTYGYLTSVDSELDKNVSGYESTRTYKASDVKEWVSAQYGVTLTGNKSDWFSITYDSGGLYAKTVDIGSKKGIRGTELRDKLFTSARVGSANVLRSHAVTITYNAGSDNFVFLVRGYGHGVGMSQAGADQYAKAGWDYAKILTHYYRGATLTK